MTQTYRQIQETSKTNKSLFILLFYLLYCLLYCLLALLFPCGVNRPCYSLVESIGTWDRDRGSLCGACPSLLCRHPWWEAVARYAEEGVRWAVPGQLLHQPKSRKWWVTSFSCGASWVPRGSIYIYGEFSFLPVLQHRYLKTGCLCLFCAYVKILVHAEDSCACKRILAVWRFFTFIHIRFQ